MVVAALFEQIVPSQRGLTRDERVAGAMHSNNNDGDDDRDDQVWQYQAMDVTAAQATPQTTRMPATTTGNMQSIPPTQQQQLQQQQQRRQRTTAVPAPATRQKRKRFKATKCLRSMAADFDVTTDWVFYFHCRREDQRYREDYEQNPDADKAPYLIPPSILWIIFVVCILGTLLWMILATDGKVAAPLLRVLGYDKLSMGYVLFLSVIVEDVPQVILTFLVEDYFKENGQFNNYALVNVIASLYDTLIKLAEAFDERADVVETGIWCKESIWTHNKKVTCVLPLPLLEEDRGNTHQQRRAIRSPSVRGRSAPQSGPNSRLSSARIHMDSVRTTTRQTLLQETREIVSETKLPRLRFLSASKDQTARLWDTSSVHAGLKRNQYVQKFKGHSSSVSCMAFVNFPYHSQRSLSLGPDDESGIHQLHDNNSVFFLTGSSDGTIKLWDTGTDHVHRTFEILSTNSNDKDVKVTCIAYLGNDPTAAMSSSSSMMNFHQSNNDHLFVSGYKSGKVRLWNLMTGICLVEFEAHAGKVNAICKVKNSTQFATAGTDGAVKVWSFSNDNGNKNSYIATSTTRDPDHTVVGHTGPVLSVTSVSRQILLTGSEDCTARVWSLANGSCLRVFAGHTKAVTTVAVVDSITFLTGSKDTTIKVWDGVSASCIRTYTGHTGTVTSVATTFQSGTFISASEDQTVKLWIFTAVLPALNAGEDGGTLNDLLGVDDSLACMTCRNDTTDDSNEIV